MNYYLDTEFDGPGGPLLSMGLVREDGVSLYATCRLRRPITDPWVRDNVVPIMYDIPHIGIDYKLIDCTPQTLAVALYDMLRMDSGLVNIITDWPIDIAYFCNAMIVGPGRMINIEQISFLMARVDAYPTDLVGAVQHNSYWDAMALRHHFKVGDNDE